MDRPQAPPPAGRAGARRSGRVVTPEAVALDLQTATVATRGLAALLDVVLQLLAVLLVAGALAVADLGDAPGTVFVVVVLLAVLIIRVGYPVLMETRFGATVGHMALGLRVVTVDGAPIRLRQALARVAVGMFELDATLGSVALLVAAARHDGRRLGDLAAGTQVVSTRVGTGPSAPLDLRVPPRLRDWAASLDTTGLGQAERTALRRYLGRASDLPAERRHALAADLADRLLPRVGVSRPASTTAHDALVAIAATLASRAEGPSGDANHAGPPPPPSEGTTPPTQLEPPS